ncbi:hypothetical protein P3T76_000190 [Phytophthora citrophthora]|uniref:Ras-GEF domain-containing protein n=1 Tax=Phytophthora citrophthora TaxID=4793 RepID=A0AAD9LS55_9STRA|nr:hypothetical protein P3T76_000190 [Phytophthora citrophthora]
MLPSMFFSHWRDRYVLVKPGEMIIRRRREGSIKAKIDLLDTNLKLTFLGGQSLFTISMHGRDTVFDFRSTVTRDEWISAIVSAQERPDSEVDCDEDGTEHLSVDETDDQEGHKRSSMTSMGTEKSDTMDDDSEGYNDALLALQSVRDSVMQCHLSMGAAEIDSFINPRDHPTPAFTKAAPSLRRVQSAKRSEEELRQKRLRSLLTLIESTPHGGRVVLLHLGVVASAGINVGDMLLALGEKQRDNPRRGSFTPRTLSTQKHNVASFIRDILFHPIYSKREEVNTEVVQGLIDLFFPHCRLRRFSDDTEYQQVQPAPNNTSRVTAKSENDAEVDPSSTSAATPTTTLNPSRPQRRKRRNHSFPNLGGISQLAKSKGLLPTSTDDNNRSISARKLEEGGHRLRDNLSVLFAPMTPSPAPGGGRDLHIPLLSPSTPFTASASDELDFICEDIPLPVPLRSMLWEMSCSEMAEQLTIFHHSQLSNVHPWEFLHHPKQAAKELTEHFNRLVAYFVWSVLVEDSPKGRAEVIEDIISIAMAASAPPLNNFHLVMACVGCLGDTPLMSSRMPTTWKKVRVKYKTRLGELRRLCDHSGGFENLRRKQSTESARPVLSSDVSTASIIPFIGVIGVMLERLRSTSYFTAKKMLDVEKMERQYMVLNVLENALLKPAPRPSRIPQRGKTSPSETAAAMTTRLQQFFKALRMEFATSRFHQLRSQQILANETSATSSASASFGLGTTLNGSNRGGVPVNLTASKFDSSIHSSIGPSEDSGLPFVSFRDICVLLVSVPEMRERMQMALEALFVDGRQPATQFLRKFWLDFKQNVWISGVGPTLQSVRLCVSALYQEVMTYKITELMQITGLDENSSELHDVVYAKLVVVTVQPIYLKIVSKVKRNFVKEDAHASARLLQSTPQVVVDSNKPTIPWSSCSCSSPVELLDLVCQLVALPRASTTTAAVAATDHQLAAVELLGALQHQARHTFLATNPVSSLYLMKQILDPKYLPLARRQALEVFIAAVTWLRKEQEA